MEPQVNKEHYFRKKYDDLERFISYFYQTDLARSLEPKKILEIGMGSGFFSDYLKKLGYSVTTCDFDKNLDPDIVADIRSLPIQNGEFYAFAVQDRATNKISDIELIHSRKPTSWFTIRDEERKEETDAKTK